MVIGERAKVERKGKRRERSTRGNQRAMPLQHVRCVANESTQCAQKGGVRCMRSGQTRAGARQRKTNERRKNRREARGCSAHSRRPGQTEHGTGREGPSGRQRREEAEGRLGRDGQTTEGESDGCAAASAAQRCRTGGRHKGTPMGQSERTMGQRQGNLTERTAREQDTRERCQREASNAAPSRLPTCPDDTQPR